MSACVHPDAELPIYDLQSQTPRKDIALQKTGYTVDAGRCLVMKALIQDRAVVMVLLHSVGKYTRVADAGRIRKWVENTAGMRTASVLRSQNLN